jgi:hypothetical protein
VGTLDSRGHLRRARHTGGTFAEWLDGTDIGDGRVVFDAHNVFPDGEDRVYTSILFLRTAEEFQRELDLAGFTDIAWTGDWHGAPAVESSRFFVFRARRR